MLYFSNISTGFKTVSTYAILCMLIAAVQQSVKIRLRLRLVNFCKIVSLVGDNTMYTSLTINLGSHMLREQQWRSVLLYVSPV